MSVLPQAWELGSVLADIHRMVIVAVFCLMVGHPGFGFKEDNKQYPQTLVENSHELEPLPSTAGTGAGSNPQATKTTN